MLKLLKWVYELGANQENARIRSIIEQTRVQADYSFGQLEDVLLDGRSSVAKKDRAWIKQQGQLARISLIDAITRQDGEYVSYSLIDRPKAKK